MDRLFSTYGIDEIAKKTHISPMFLEKLKNDNLENIEIIKLRGFLKILKSEYPEFDFSQLEEYIDNVSVQNETLQQTQNSNKEENSNVKIYFILLLLIIALISLLFYMKKIENVEMKIFNNKSLEKIDNKEKNITKEIVVKELK